MSKPMTIEETQKCIYKTTLLIQALEQKIESKENKIKMLTLQNETLQNQYDNLKDIEDKEYRAQVKKEEKEERHSRYLYASQHRNFRPKMCSFFMKGYCKNGSSCTFSHSSSDTNSQDEHDI